jgi:GT2 family glycosyltransferase
MTVSSIIIPVFNQVSFTQKCVNDLMNLSSDHEVIIVDNNSTDGTSDFIKSFMENKSDDKPDFKYIRINENLGFGAANNIGVEKSEGEYLLFLNNDVAVLKNKSKWLDDLTKDAGDKLISSQAGLLNNNFNFVRESSEPHVLQDKFEYLSGWSVLGSRKTFNQIAKEEGVIWSKKYFAYFEDVHLSWKARQLGITMEVVKTPLHHFGRMTSSKIGLSEMYKKSYNTFSKYWKEKI